jgi:hypothetical protein
MEEQSSGEFASTALAPRAQDAALQERRLSAKFLSTHTAFFNTFNVQRHLTSAKTHRTLRAAATSTWRKTALAL